jgi:tRNA pseudouridine32 synthase/23S rRNA pseudouridine746 synthase
VTKTYLAVLDGVPEGEEGVIDMPLAKISSEAEGWRMVNDPDGRPSLTRWRRIAVRDGRAIIHFSPETGRTHQIRVHSADGLGIPISGDPVYGGSNGPMLLHALSIRVDRDGKPPVEATAPLPPTFLSAGLGDLLDGEPLLAATPPVAAALLESGPSPDLGDVRDD